MRYVKHGCIGLVIGILLELFVFGFGSLRLLMDTSVEERVLSIHDFETVNWTETEGTLTARPDPMLVMDGLNDKVRTVTIYYRSEPQPDRITLFYTNSQYPEICQETVRTASPTPRQRAVFKVNDTVQGLRIDVGEVAGLQLSDLRVVFNEKHFDFSVSRVVAMVLIWIVGSFLFSIQRMPDYHLESFGVASDHNFHPEENP